ncbi:MAG TPA: hypothetical protein VNF75_04720 [Candidatus Dormibacteraeota bacterium]|nr:hypothetical protein [Candidatus Dormibacteraeota bacterium]
MTTRAAARHLLTGAASLVTGLQVDPVARVRRAADSALAHLYLSKGGGPSPPG